MGRYIVTLCCVFHFSHALTATCNSLEAHPPAYPYTHTSTQVTAVQRTLVLELLKSSNFSRLLNAVHECRNLLENSRLTEEADEGGAVEVS